MAPVLWMFPHTDANSSCFCTAFVPVAGFEAGFAYAKAC